MEEVHKLGGAHLYVENDLVDAGDEDVVEEVANDANNKTTDGGDHGLVHAGGKGVDFNIITSECHVLEASHHTGNGAEETNHGTRGVPLRVCLRSR